MTADRLRVHNCTMTFNHGQHNEVIALDSIDLALSEGDHVVVVGSNGAGKSTLLDVVCGRHIPDSGRVEIDGVNVTEQPEHIRAKRIGRVFQNPTAGTAASMTIEENLALAEGRSGRRRLRWIDRSRTELYKDRLAQLGMGLEDRLTNEVGSLSGGQRQALALLMAAMSMPDVLILDEHTAALDPAAAERVLELTCDLVSTEGLTALMVTHNMQHALDVGNRTVMMHRGKVLFETEGDVRSRLTLEDLVDRFRSLGAVVSDRTALN
ncbi:MAG: ATP-binding cassette domain-containing protein [Actinomycetia bacterium]|nr:ATP-binding cassette domain-containing protein [Actinomycetes bacterium]MCP5035451.1 ATP-binding cassette domain-containing protein [Actinomycetes bacterium]